MIAVAVQSPPNVEVDATTHPSFADAFLAVTNIVFAFSMILVCLISRYRLTGKTSCPHRVLRLYLGNEGCPRFPQVVDHAPGDRHITIHRYGGGYLPLRRSGCRITRAGLGWTRDGKSRLRASHSNCA